MEFFSRTIDMHLWVYVLVIVCLVLNILTNIYSIIQYNRRHRGD